MSTSVASPAAEKLSVRFDGVEAYDVAPQRVSTLYRGQQLVLFGRYKGSGEGKLTISGELLGKPETLTAKFSFPAEDGRNPQIQRMWAWRKVDGLMAQVRESGESPSLRSEVVALGTRYSIMTPYTAFLVLENEAEYQRFNIDRANARRVETERAAQQQQRQQPDESHVQVARDVKFSGNRSGGGGGGGGAVEWVFLGGLGLLAAGRLLTRKKKEEEGLVK